MSVWENRELKIEWRNKNKLKGRKPNLTFLSPSLARRGPPCQFCRPLPLQQTTLIAVMTVIDLISMFTMLPLFFLVPHFQANFTMSPPWCYRLWWTMLPYTMFRAGLRNLGARAKINLGAPIKKFCWWFWKIINFCMLFFVIKIFSVNWILFCIIMTEWGPGPRKKNLGARAKVPSDPILIWLWRCYRLSPITRGLLNWNFFSLNWTEFDHY